MLRQEENDLLTRVGPGTPAGELLRRFWMPVAVARELTPLKPTKFVRILGEDLVLFLDKSGRVGLLADHCSHRGASMLYGRVEERGIACAYHAWLYDTEGNVLETPPERNDAIIKSIRQTAYPIQKFIGLYWAYLGPQPAPVIPPYDIWVRNDGRRELNVRPVVDANYFQIMENSMDSAHLEILHQDTAGRGRLPVNSTRGFIDDVSDYGFYQTDWGGLMKTRSYRNGQVDEHPLIFPNVLRVGNRTQIRVPIDDTHTMHIATSFEPNDDGTIVDNDDPPVRYDEPYKTPPDGRHPFMLMRTDTVQSQDYMVWETQGPITNRTREHLSFADKGIVLLRKVFRENIERVRRGEDPYGLIRDPNHPMIDTNLTESIRQERAGRPYGSATATVEAVSRR